ncbi:hypothetical protein [Methylobacterium sp. 37f]|uniref:hypothetical protein n=1 Tax=Methylobacterium sp. 37f TaxID=2817058 RepID=UPI001FFCAF2A|nr:hypothetical protein [Methylobacterium sp. 37f]MCK2055761.1 hypothetical protein [Methylobacterium sp. 37f]
MATFPPGEAAPARSASADLKVLCDRLLAGPSATRVLEDWSRERGLAPASGLVAHAVAGPDRPASPAMRARLKVPPDALVRYRRVRLACGALVLSEADNWYVPDRLTRDMNRMLETSEVPFGRVVHALAPSRQTLALRLLPGAGRPESVGPDDPLFAIEALLLRQDGLPLCEVAEIYAGAVLGRASS